MDTNKPTVATPSPRMAALAEKRELVNDLMGGTFAMRAKSTRWLPQHPAESDGVYKTRLEKTYLDNFLSDTIDKAAGKIFSRPMKLCDTPPQIEELLDNIDGEGSGLDAFAQEVGKRSLAAGISYVLVDVPPAEGVKTAAQEKQAGIRPYTVHVDPDNILEILTTMKGGKETIQRVRIKECLQESDGEWGYKKVERVRVLEMRGGVMCFDVYEERKDEKNNTQKQWVPIPELSGVTTFPAIYLVPFYSNRTAFMEGEPGFQNIAESCLEHWQTKSEYNHALSMQCFGMLTATGLEADEVDKIQVGPAKVLKSTRADAKFTYTEPSGVGITLSAEALKAIESRIDSAGVNLRVENAGQVTATAASIDSAETNAGIVAVANGFADSWETVLTYMANIMKIGDGSEDCGGEVEIITNFGGVKGTQAGLTELGKARQMGDISREAYIEALIWRGELQEDFDMEANDAALEGEEPPLGGMAGKQPGQQDPAPQGQDAMQKCPECGKMAPMDAKKCPECGADMPMKGGGPNA